MDDNKCYDCGHIFHNKYNLRRHHSNPKPCVYNCPDCNEKFKYKTSYNEHVKRCKMGEFDLQNFCEHCGKKYASRNSLTTHIRICPIKNKSRNELEAVYRKSNNTIDTLKNKLEEKNREIEKLKEMVSKDSPNTGTNINNGIINNGKIVNNHTDNSININPTFNILCPFGTEDVGKLNGKRLMEIFHGSINDLLPRFIREMHVNPELPENHNIFYDAKLGRIKVFAGESSGWIDKDHNGVMEQMQKDLQNATESTTLNFESIDYSEKNEQVYAQNLNNLFCRWHKHAIESEEDVKKVLSESAAKKMIVLRKE